jgi:signal transduction histidine kinase/ActR/RegA family two-component response regulator
MKPALLHNWRPHFTIRHTLLAITAGLTLMIAILSARALLDNAERVLRIQDLRAATAVSDQLFDATGKVSVERDLTLAMLQAQDRELVLALAPMLAESRRQSDAAVSVALAAFRQPGLQDLESVGGELNQRFAALQALRAQVDAAVALPAPRRDPLLSQAWNNEATTLMSGAEALWIEFIDPFARIDATVTLHLRYGHMLRTITDYSGRERSIIGQILSQQGPATPEQTAELLRAEGVLDLSWRTSRLLARQSGLLAEIAPEFEDAESHYATLVGMTRSSFYIPGARRADYPIGADLWFELSSQASESLGLLRQASQAATRRHLDAMLAEARQAIAIQSLVTLIALGLCIASFWVILARVIGPINRIVDALMRATRGEAVAFNQRARSDEIGKLGEVLGAFQSEVAVRREAEAKAHAQLERLALLHQISRAIGERQDLHSIFHVAIGAVETQLPAAFAAVALRDADESGALRIASIGKVGGAKATAMGLEEGGSVPIDQNGLSRCMRGRLVYEPDTGLIAFPFPQRLAHGGLKSLVAAPLQVESQVFGAMIVARTQAEAFTSSDCEFLRQLSEHVALAAHQAQLHGALQRAYDELRQSQDAVMQQERLKALGQMASGVAHDINNALSPIALYTESLLGTEPGLSAAGRGKLEVISRAIDDAARTIARMSEFYKRRDKEIVLGVVDPNVLVRQVLDLTQARWRDMAQSRGHTIAIRTELEDAAPSIMGLESELREALTNLVFNAVDALPQGGLITLRTRSDPAGGVYVEVEDNGVGMDEATRQRCLEPFFTTKGERGTGLGLAMVYGTLQRHGGDIEIESAPGKGALMRLRFATAVNAAAQDAGKQQAGPRRWLRLLVVDDDPVLLRTLCDVLQQDGQLVTAVSDGAEAITTFKRALEQGKGFDAVITDLGMPGLDGRRVAAAIKEASSQTPVILLTGWGERLRVEEERVLHVDHILSKPPKLSDVRAVLALCCGQDIAPNANAARA